MMFGRLLLKTLLLTGLGLGINQPQAADLDPVTLQLKWKHQFQFAGYYAAKEKGFYREAGLDVTINEASPHTDPIQEVISGKAQFGVGTTELIMNRYHGDPILVLGVIFQHSPLSLVVLADSGINNVHKLAGHKVMIEPSSAELFAYLYREGFTPKAFEQQPHSFDLSDLLSLKTDAMSVYVTDELFLLKQQGKAYIQFSPNMSGIDFYGDNFFTIESELAKHPKRVNAFREATLRGWRYAMQYPDEIIQLIYERYSQRHTIEHLRFEAKAMQDLMQPQLIHPGYMNPGRWQSIAQTYFQLGLLPENFDVNAMLYFPNSALDLKETRTHLYYALGGLSVFVLLAMVLLRFYRTVRIDEARLKTMFDHTPLALMVLDNKNRIQAWNSEAEKTFLWKEKEIHGKSVSVIVPSKIFPEVEKVLDNVRRERSIIGVENMNLKRDGTEILCEWLNAPFTDKYDHSSFIICMARDITEQKHIEKALKFAAHYDSLTLLPNRALILDLLKQSLALAEQHHYKLAILFLDLNGFKAINDTLGHEAGDLLLLAIGQRLPKAIRETDHVGRLAGDEFLVILQDIKSSENAQKIADCLQDTVFQPCMVKDQIIRISASIGISIYPDDATELNTLIHSADKHMYEEKQQGRLDKNIPV